MLCAGVVADDHDWIDEVVSHPDAGIPAERSVRRPEARAASSAAARPVAVLSLVVRGGTESAAATAMSSAAATTTAEAVIAGKHGCAVATLAGSVTIARLRTRGSRGQCEPTFPAGARVLLRARPAALIAERSTLGSVRPPPFPPHCRRSEWPRSHRHRHRHRRQPGGCRGGRGVRRPADVGRTAAAAPTREFPVSAAAAAIPAAVEPASGADVSESERTVATDSDLERFSRHDRDLREGGTAVGAVGFVVLPCSGTASGGDAHSTSSGRNAERLDPPGRTRNSRTIGPGGGGGGGEQAAASPPTATTATAMTYLERTLSIMLRPCLSSPSSCPVRDPVGLTVFGCVAYRACDPQLGFPRPIGKLGIERGPRGPGSFESRSVALMRSGGTATAKPGRGFDDAS